MAHPTPDGPSICALSYGDGSIMTQAEQGYCLNQMEAIWSRFGGSHSQTPFYGAVPLVGQHPIQWDQVPSASESGSSISQFVSPPAPQPAQPAALSARQSAFRVAMLPNATPASSSQHSEEPMQMNLNVLSPAVTTRKCTCSFRTGTLPSRMSRHWTHSCPNNPNLATYECDICGVEIGRRDNLRRHLRTAHDVIQ